MARTNARDFVGTRCRFQRLRDAKVFNGWIEDFHGSAIELSTATDTPVRTGEEFRVEGFGHHLSMVFNALLETVDSSNPCGPAGVFAEVDGTSVRLIETHRSTLKLTVCGSIRLSASPESVRILVEGLPVTVAFGTREVEGLAVDVGPNGIGVVATEAVEPGSAVAVDVTTPSGRVRAQALIRYCRKDKEREGCYRFGIMFTDMGRIERPRWEKFLFDHC